MKIFKNRGDIYISKSGYKSSKEERILLSLLAVIVVFTIIFLSIFGHKYSSVAEFFADGEITTIEVSDTVDDVLPEIYGKTNFMVLETDDKKGYLHYIYLVQADKDALAYKVTTLSPETMIDNDSINDIYQNGGSPSLQTKLTEYFGFEIDFFVQFKMSDFIEFANKLGTFVYTSNEQIKFDFDDDDDAYSIRINEGERKLTAKELTNLIRYYSIDAPNYERANAVVLYALTGLFNEDNFEDCESLFRLLISNSSTNITVRDFENDKNALQVFCQKNNDITIYSAIAEYDNNVLTQSSVKNIKGYFSK